MDPIIGDVIVAVVAAVLVAVVAFGFVQHAHARAHRAEERRLTEWADRLDREQHALAQRETEAASAEQAAETVTREAAALRAEAVAERERVAGLTADKARAEVVARAREAARREAAVAARDAENLVKRDGERRARSIMVDAMARLAVDTTADSVIVTVPLPGEEFKGRIIGREGRNIRAFEQVTGANVLIDDTPDSVVLSCFDPVRRERARVTLTDLLADGRIYPTRIEEAYERAGRRVEEDNLRAAEQAAAELGISRLNAGLLPVIGALRLRMSYGQNVLAHSLECGHLAALMAGELGCDVDSSRRAAFLHDIGKALTGKTDATHAAAGAALVKRFGESDDVVHAIAAHHNEIAPQTVEAVLVQVADAMSGSRPGARRESVEAYVERLQRLETLVAAFPGVERVFAMQAGREVRVMVQPAEVDDDLAVLLARDIAQRIEAELTYPGTIRVTVVRESRATAVARARQEAHID